MMNQSATSLSRHDVQAWANELFKRAYVNGIFRRGWQRLRGQSHDLVSLGSTKAQSGRSLGLQTIAITQIIGSEGRVADFDRNFAPREERTRDRWIQIARARRCGAALPAVRLIRTADGYFVRDGHHRISVAVALGEAFIEAEVVAWV
ncbi:MAG: hypothetical protein AB4911_11090 [Oscillochloridaceae bacterium umkhey_bin13]